QLRAVAFTDLKDSDIGVDASQYEALVTFEPAGHHHAGRVTIVLGDPCNSCEALVAFWTSHLDQSAVIAHFNIVTLSGVDAAAPLVERLRNRALPHRVLKVKNRDEFTVQTGIYGIPLTIFDNGAGGACIVTGVPSERAATMCWSILQPQG